MNKKIKQDFIYHTIKEIEAGSIAEEMEIEPGDRLVSINGKPVEDVFDYHYLVDDENLELVIEKPDGQQWALEIEKDEDEDLGIVFANSLMDEYKSCSNNCMFCFIDQMPPGMRDTLYFKDDDSRLSFLQGNYITLTNMKEKDLERIIRYKLAPINISVHTTDPALRCRMLNNRFAGDILEKIGRLYDARIPMNGQVVLCKGVNDGRQLERTIGDLARFIPCMESLSVVPVGLTKYREGLYPLEPFDREDARAVITIIEKWQKRCMEKHGIHFVQASDEWYLKAELPLPEEERYDGYIQLENGVGMIRLLLTEFHEALADRLAEKDKKEEPKRAVTLATGVLAEPFIRQMAGELMQVFPGIKAQVVAIRNDFFGERITVSGLITGRDLIAQLKGEKLGDALLIPANMIRAGEDVFLDDITISQVEKALQVPLDIVKSSGRDLLEAMTGEKDE